MNFSSLFSAARDFIIMWQSSSEPDGGGEERGKNPQGDLILIAHLCVCVYVLVHVRVGEPRLDFLTRLRSFARRISFYKIPSRSAELSHTDKNERCWSCCGARIALRLCGETREYFLARSLNVNSLHARVICLFFFTPALLSIDIDYHTFVKDWKLLNNRTRLFSRWFSRLFPFTIFLQRSHFFHHFIFLFLNVIVLSAENYSVLRNFRVINKNYYGSWENAPWNDFGAIIIFSLRLVAKNSEKRFFPGFFSQKFLDKHFFFIFWRIISRFRECSLIMRGASWAVDSVQKTWRNVRRRGFRWWRDFRIIVCARNLFNSACWLNNGSSSKMTDIASLIAVMNKNAVWVLRVFYFHTRAPQRTIFVELRFTLRWMPLSHAESFFIVRFFFPPFPAKIAFFHFYFLLVFIFFILLIYYLLLYIICLFIFHTIFVILLI